MLQENEQARVLIAEDQEHVREALAMLLRGSGYSVLLCASPREALDVAALQSFDLALVDMNYRRDSTSGVEGLNLIESLRQLDNTLPIAALTAWGNVDLAVNAMKSGASDFIEKPWRNDALLDKVGSLTRRGREVRSQQRISEYEKQDAQQVQMRIVPRRHIVAGGVEIFGESVPFGNVGGDYFGLWQPTPESLHFCVADVSGKGTSGALIAAMLHASVSTLAVADGGAAKVVGEVESILREQLGDEHFVTMFYAVLDVTSYVLEYVNGGHCPAILRRANGTVEMLDSTRPVLGLLGKKPSGAERIKLNAGDRLALYTDGITEAADAGGEEFGDLRLQQTVTGGLGLPVSQMQQRVLDAVQQFSNGKQEDDVTIVIAQCLT